MPAKLRRTYRGEEKWFPLLDDLGHVGLRRQFIAAGISPTLAGQLVWFLEEQRSLERHLTHNSRRNYRSALGRLDPDRVSRAIPRQFNSDLVAA